MTHLVEQGRRPGLPGLLPAPTSSLAEVPALVLAELARCQRGVIVLAVDGLSHPVAARGWPSAEIGCLTSTFPSTSATGWLTALTGVGPAEHGVPGMVHQVGSALVYAVTGTPLAGSVRPGDEPVRPWPTLFERAAAAGAHCLVAGRELDHLSGRWAPALLRGALRVGPQPSPSALAAQAGDPHLLAGAVTATVTGILAAGAGTPPVLLWIYVNLDDHIHAHGYSQAVLAALRELDTAARSWAGCGWTVVAHSDHGQVPVRPDPGLAREWARLDDPAECALPAGGAGRVRWLHPRPGREAVVRARLAEALGDAAVVLAPDELDLPATLALPLDRVGRVLAIAASPRFPLPDPRAQYEHGGLDPDEMVIPFAVWRPPRG